MRLPIQLLMSFILCTVACRQPGHPGKKDKDSAPLKMDSGGNRKDPGAALTDPANSNEDSIELSKLKMRFSDTSIPFEGLWVNEHYVNEIKGGKPIRECQDTETKCIVVPRRTLQVTSIIFGFHEGGQSLAFVKKGSEYFAHALYDGHCVDTLHVLAGEKLKFGRDYYVRVGEEDSTLPDLGVLEQLLFAGEYKRPDAAGAVSFEKNGKIDGLDSLSWYEPAIDYTDWGYETKLDHIRLGADREHLHDYGFRFVGNTLEIYTIDCLKKAGNDCILDTLGRQMYALQKIE
jgi:hypothetical protein